MIIKAQALKYIAAGVSVIPLKKDKRPILGSWKEFQTRHATKEEVESWFAKWPDAQLGIVTGKISNILVIDIDVRHGGSIDIFDQNTTVVKTGNGGFHLYYKYKEGVGNSVGILAGVDIRGDGGYCFTAGHRVVVKPKNKQFNYSKSIKIEDLKVGDEVLSYNEETSQIEAKPIIRIGNRKVDETFIIKFGNRQGMLRCTYEHPIYTTEGWKKAGEIKRGDELLHFSRQQLHLPITGHTFPKGVQSRVGKNGSDYQRTYIQNRPNHLLKKSKYEEFVSDLVQREQLPVKYVGDGSLIIKHKDFLLHPDFVVEGKKKVIEVHIDYHFQKKQDGEKQVLRNSTQEERRKMYENEGWECLLLNANEWQAFNGNTIGIIEYVREQLIKFVCNGKKVEFVHKVHDDTTVYNIEVSDNHTYFIASKDENKKDWYLVHNCVAPPSVTSYPGKTGQMEGGEYKVLKALPFAEYPTLTDGKYVSSRKKLADLTSVTEGNRNQSMASLIGKLLLTTPPDKWDAEIWPVALQVNQTYSPPLPEYEVKTTYQSICSKEIKRKADLNSIKEKVTDEKVKQMLSNIETSIDDPKMSPEAREESLARLKEVARIYAGEDALESSSEIVERLKNEPEETKYFTGWEHFDSIVGGFRPGQLVIFSGYTKSGKTNCLMDLTDKFREFSPVWIPLEEGSEELVRKFLERGIQPPLWFSPKTITKVNLEWIESKIVEGIAKHNTKMVMIDQLDFIVPLQTKDHHQMIGEVVRAVRSLARKWGVVIYLICHLNGMAKMTQAPSMENLKGSTSIQQEADTVILVWRETDRVDGGILQTNNSMISIQANRRVGRTGNVKMVFNYQTGHYEEKDWETREEANRRVDKEFKNFGKQPEHHSYIK